MKNIQIPEPCGENFQLMPATERGAFCSKCATDTFDFRNKSNEEIRAILKEQLGKKVCGQFTTAQLDALNREFEEWTFRSTKSFQSGFLFALIAVFGLTLFSCTDQKQEKDLISFQETTKFIVDNLNTESDSMAVEIETVTEVMAPDVYETEVITSIGGAVAYDIAPEPLIEVLPPEILVREEFVTAGIVAYDPSYEDFLIADSIDESGRIIPKEYSSLTFPNPTSSISTLEIKAPHKEKFQIDLYDMNGKLLRNIYSGKIERGTFRQEYDLRDLPTGTYLVTILSKVYKETLRVSKL